jgi:hypothetical protein
MPPARGGFRLNTHGHNSVAKEVGLPLLQAALQRAGKGSPRLGAFYMGNWLTDVSQAVDPVAYAALITKGPKFVNALVQGLQSSRLVGLMGMKDDLGKFGKDLGGMLELLATREGPIAKAFKNAFLVLGYFKFVHPRTPGARSRMSCKAFLKVFDTRYVQYYPHEHLDRPEILTSTKAEPEYESKIAKGTLTPKESGGSAELKPHIYEYLQDDLKIAAGYLARADLEFARRSFLPGSGFLPDDTDEQWNLQLAELGHVMHMVEDFFSHSNFIEHAARELGDEYLPSPKDAKGLDAMVYAKRLKKYTNVHDSEAKNWSGVPDEPNVVTGYFDSNDTIISLSHIARDLFGNFKERRTYRKHLKEEAGKGKDATPGKAAELTLQHLFCNKQEDWTGKDDIYFYVVPEGGERTRVPRVGTYRMSDKDKDPKYINQRISFRGSVVLEMWEEDIDLDDKLGTMTLKAAATPRDSASFTGHSTDYVLAYDINVPPEPAKPAEEKPPAGGGKAQHVASTERYREIFGDTLEFVNDPKAAVGNKGNTLAAELDAHFVAKKGAAYREDASLKASDPFARETAELVWKNHLVSGMSQEMECEELNKRIHTAWVEAIVAFSTYYKIGETAVNLYRTVQSIYHLITAPFHALKEAMLALGLQRAADWFSEVGETINWYLEYLAYEYLGHYRIGCHSLLNKDCGPEVLYNQQKECTKAVHWYILHNLTRWSRPLNIRASKSPKTAKGAKNQKNRVNSHQWIDWRELLEYYLRHPAAELPQAADQERDLTFSVRVPHEVKKGDTLNDLARTYGAKATIQPFTWQAIADANYDTAGLSEEERDRVVRKILGGGAGAVGDLSLPEKRVLQIPGQPHVVKVRQRGAALMDDHEKWWYHVIQKGWQAFAADGKGGKPRAVNRHVPVIIDEAELKKLVDEGMKQRDKGVQAYQPRKQPRRESKSKDDSNAPVYDSDHRGSIHTWIVHDDIDESTITISNLQGGFVKLYFEERIWYTWEAVHPDGTEVHPEHCPKTFQIEVDSKVWDGDHRLRIACGEDVTYTLKFSSKDR